MCCAFWVVFVFLSFFFNPSEPSFNASGENNINNNNNNRLGHYLTIFHFAVVGCWLVFRANLHLVIWRLYRSAASHTETDKQTRESNLHQQLVSVVWLRWLMSEQVSKPCSFFCKIEFFFVWIVSRRETDTTSSGSNWNVKRKEELRNRSTQPQSCFLILSNSAFCSF